MWLPHARSHGYSCPVSSHRQVIRRLGNDYQYTWGKLSTTMHSQCCDEKNNGDMIKWIHQSIEMVKRLILIFSWINQIGWLLTSVRPSVHDGTHILVYVMTTHIYLYTYIYIILRRLVKHTMCNITKCIIRQDLNNSCTAVNQTTLPFVYARCPLQ